MRTLPALLSLALLAACVDTVEPPPPEPLKFTGPSYTFNVAEINVAQDYHSPKRLPNVEHLSDITPAQAVKQWAGTRLVAAGHAGALEVDIKDASIVHRTLPRKTTGVEGWFTTEQTEEYDGTLEVEMKIYNSKNILPVAHLSVVAHQSRTLAENASIAERDQALHQITVDLIHTLEPELDANIHRYLGLYLL